MPSEMFEAIFSTEEPCSFNPSFIATARRISIMTISLLRIHRYIYSKIHSNIEFFFVYTYTSRNTSWTRRGSVPYSSLPWQGATCILPIGVGNKEAGQDISTGTVRIPDLWRSSLLDFEFRPPCIIGSSTNQPEWRRRISRRL